MTKSRSGVDIRKIYDDADRVTMMKLLLDNTEYAQASKERLQETLESIKTKGHIDECEDVFLHFFREIFRASKTRLGPDFGDSSSVEVTFCVPEVKFGTNGESPCNIFVVHEAEAQAMQALTETLNELERGETFVLVDCGGGTTDIGIYRIALTEPLRLGSEVHEAMGDLNDKFRSLVKGILRKELYLENGEDTIDTIVAAEAMFKFENDIKRSFQYDDTEATYPIRIRGLRESRSEDRIRDNYLPSVESKLTCYSQDVWNIFRPSVRKIGTMMEDAVVNAKNAGYAVSKVVVVGGFGDSPCLQSYLLQQKDRIVRNLGQPLKLRFSPRNMSATGVATGAILRAINKANGPSRIPCQSIGILRHIPCDQPEDYPAEVLSQPSKWSAAEQKPYVMNTIHWVVKKVSLFVSIICQSADFLQNDEMLESVHTVRFLSEHVFQANDREWVVEEQLWASETCTLDFYKLDHEHNAGKTTEIGAVEFDITTLRQRIRTANRRDRETIDKAVILVEMTVIDRNLEFTARWPPTPEGEIIQGSRRFFSVASAFTPGTQ
ncbi:hypothetical protein N0V87_001366 [Didymella glomerata]|uniref:Uncharacterized protein n=1 Tax=Didymella glomerata TaxID=749621 RepID=A0A9W8X680_9PLEO|nr:hypothetical protein N0V87_001366 [Didymella glomerata]